MPQRPVPSSAILRLVRPAEESDLVARCVARDPLAQRALFERLDGDDLVGAERDLWLEVEHELVALGGDDL